MNKSFEFSQYKGEPNYKFRKAYRHRIQKISPRNLTSNVNVSRRPFKTRLNKFLRHSMYKQYFKCNNNLDVKAMVI